MNDLRDSFFALALKDFNELTGLAVVEENMDVYAVMSAEGGCSNWNSQLLQLVFH